MRRQMFWPNSDRKSEKIDIHCANATFRMRNFWPCNYLYLAVLLNVNTWSVWFIILVILSFSNGCKSVGGVTMYINMVVFDIFETTVLQVGFTWNGLHTLVRPSLIWSVINWKKYFQEVTTFLSLLWQLWCHRLKKSKWTNAASKAQLYCRTWRHLTQSTIKCWNNTYILLFGK